MFVTAWKPLGISNVMIEFFLVTYCGAVSEYVYHALNTGNLISPKFLSQASSLTRRQILSKWLMWVSSSLPSAM